MKTVHLFIPPALAPLCGEPKPTRSFNALAWYADLAPMILGDHVCGPCMAAYGERLAMMQAEGRTIP